MSERPSGRAGRLARQVLLLLLASGLLMMPAVTARMALATSPFPPDTTATSAPTPRSIDFTYTGGPQTFVVPWTGPVTFDVYGAQGGGDGTYPAGLGGRAVSVIPVKAGELLTIMVGGAGKTTQCNWSQSIPGGFNGGGAGGHNTEVHPDGTCTGGSGGGASDVRAAGAALGDRVIVAGGGGGATHHVFFTCGPFAPAAGGAGGGLVGAAGGCDGGSGGGQSGHGGSGRLGVGGDGAPYCGGFTCPVTGGGGGGGGYYGGAGGTTSHGGGGGSGYGPTGTAFETGVRHGNGLVTVKLVEPQEPTLGFDLVPNGDSGWFTTPTATGSATASDVHDGNSPITGLVCRGSRVHSGTPAGLGTSTATLPFAVSADPDQGTHTVTCYAANAVHKVATATVTVKIDTLPPTVARDPAADHCSVAGIDGWCRGTQTAGFSAHDPVSGLAQPSQGRFTRSTGTEGSAVMIWSGPARDVAGNTSLGLEAGPFRIDHAAPVFSGEPIPVSVRARTVRYPTPEVGDDLDPLPAVFCTPASGTRLPVGTTTITCTATDWAGNHATYRQVVVVK